MAPMFFSCIVCATIAGISAFFVSALVLFMRFRRRIFGRNRGNEKDRSR